MSVLNTPTNIGLAILSAADKLVAPLDSGMSRLCILNYHRVLPTPDQLLDEDPDVESFRWQMELLANFFNVLPLSEAIEGLAAQRIPARAVCITFDDGYRSTHDLALPILKEYGLPATVFVTSSYVGNGNMWNDRIVEAIRHFQGDKLDLSTLSMGVQNLRTMIDRRRVASLVIQHAKYLPAPAREDLTYQLEQLAGHSVSPEQMLTPDMLITLSKNGVEIGAHTLSHPILTSVDDETARKEIIDSKHQLEKIIGKPVVYFAYPNGKPGLDFDHRHVEMAKDAGYSAAFTTSVSAATSMHDRFQLPRCLPWDKSPLTFAARLLHWLRAKSS